MPEEHTLKFFEQELNALRELTRKLGELGEQQVIRAVSAADGADASMATAVIEAEPDADRLEYEIEGLVIRLLALRQPMAVDLREILAALRIANELERICDYAEGIAKRALTISTIPHLPTESLRHLGLFAARMLHDAMAAYLDRDAERAFAVWCRDEELDQMYTGLFRELLMHMFEDPRHLSAGSHLLLMARDIERIGDHTTNIAEMVRYAVIGTRQSEARRKADVTKSMLVSQPSDTKPISEAL